MKLSQALSVARRAVIDTMVLIYYFEDAPPHSDRANTVIEGAASGLFEGLVTPITAAEVLVKPIETRRPDLADRYRQAIEHLSNVRAVGASFETGYIAAALRAKYRLPLPDMLQVAIAIEHNPCAVVTNDKALRRVEETPIILLDQLNA